MKSILVITPRFPYPVIGGDRLRIYQICKELSAHYKVTLLSLCETKSEMQLITPLDNVFSKIERFYLPRWRSWLNCFFSSFSQTPLQVAYYRHNSFQARAIELMIEHDATLAHLIRTGFAIRTQPGIKFLEMTDAISLNYQRIKKGNNTKNDIRSIVYSFEADRLQACEKLIVDDFDHTFLVSDVDKQYLFSDNPKKLNKVSIFSNGVDLESMVYSFNPVGRDIIFIGNMFSLQNLDAVLYMAQEILPLIRQDLSDVKLVVIGRIKAEHAKKLSFFDGVFVTGEVENVALSASSGGVGVCPLRLGAGVQNKVLEYMALGLPTVTTSMGLEGFYAKNGRDLIVADEPHEIASAVVSLLSNRVEAEQIAKAARIYVEDNHSWSTMLRPLVNLIKQSV